MVLQKLEIEGLRGFVNKQELLLAEPNGQIGSGLTVLVGPNNGGKSTVIEAFRAAAYPSTNDPSQPQSFTEGRRNKRADDRVQIQATDSSGNVSGLRTVASGGSETEWHPSHLQLDLFVLPSRRYFEPYFSKSIADRDTYTRSYSSAHNRGAPLQAFGYRLFQVQRNRAAFDDILGKVAKPLPNWTIEQSDMGNYYLKVETGGLHHSSEGMGEGLVSLLIIIDALYDSRTGGIVVIDEPELSLHPSLQRRYSPFSASTQKTGKSSWRPTHHTLQTSVRWSMEPNSLVFTLGMVALPSPLSATRPCRTSLASFEIATIRMY